MDLKHIRAPSLKRGKNDGGLNERVSHLLLLNCLIVGIYALLDCINYSNSNVCNSESHVNVGNVLLFIVFVSLVVYNEP